MKTFENIVVGLCWLGIGFVIFLLLAALLMYTG